LSKNYAGKKYLLAAVMISVLVLFTGCGLFDITSPQNYQVDVDVFNHFTEPVPEAQVNLGTFTEIADQEGRATFQLEAGTYDMEVLLDEKVKFQGEAVVTNDQVFEVFLNLVEDWRELNPDNEENGGFERLAEHHNLILEDFNEKAPEINNDFDIVNFTVESAENMGFINEENKDEAAVNGAVAALFAQGFPQPGQWWNWEDLLDYLNDILDKIISSVNQGITDGHLKVENQEAALHILNELTLDEFERFTTDSQVILDEIFSAIGNAEEGLILETIGKLKNIEQKIDDPGLPDGEKSSLFVANALARYSSAYWVADQNDDESIWPKAANGGKGRWRRIIGKDIVGGLTGYIAGGNLGGALVGAAASSIEEALNDDD